MTTPIDPQLIAAMAQGPAPEPDPQTAMAPPVPIAEDAAGPPPLPMDMTGPPAGVPEAAAPPEPDTGEQAPDPLAELRLPNRDQVGYQWARCCGTCMNFIAPCNCAIVLGNIRTDGVCLRHVSDDGLPDDPILGDE